MDRQKVSSLFRFQVDGYDDRRSVVMALVNNGYSVRVDVIKDSIRGDRYFVVIEDRKVRNGQAEGE